MSTEPIYGVTQDMMDAALAKAIEGVAQGATREETRAYVAKFWPGIGQDANLMRTTLSDALDEAQSFGIEREDIDDSWFERA